MKSRKIIKHYQRLVYWCDGLEKMSACWRAKDSGVEYTEEENKQMHEARRLLEQAKKIVSDIYAKHIGEAVTYDVRVGEYK